MMELRYLTTEWYMSRKSRLILTNSIGVKHELVDWARVPADKVRVLPNLIDVEEFRPPSAAERAAARGQWEIPAGRRAILLPGRLGLQKNQLGVLWAMRSLARQGRWPQDAILLLAGRARDRGVTTWVRRLARDPALAPSVRFLGAVEDVRSLYWASDLLLLPSLYEGLANAALEGCAAGLPAILSHAANVDGIVRPGETGWEVPTGRRGPLARALEEALAASPDELAAMGRRGRAHVVARFAPHGSYALDQMVAVYDELLAGNHAS
jgi:glycosyltransferase involved in cell wall biosynthesis